MNLTKKKICKPKSIFGTARLGMQEYGYPKKSYLNDRKSLIEDIIDLGVDTFDTAPSYGDAENIIGQVLKGTKSTIAVNTKVAGLVAGDRNSSEKIFDSVLRSIEALGIEQLETVYLHQNSLEIISDQWVHEGLYRIVEEKLAKHIGASLYYVDEIDYALGSAVFDTIQVACNLCDRSVFDRCLEFENILVDCRTVLLQGLLANPQYAVGVIKNFRAFNEDIMRLEKLSNSIGISLSEMAYAYVGNLSSCNGILIGSTNIANFSLALNSLRLNLPVDIIAEIDSISKLPKNYSNPKLWESKK